jgi:hypothetical protein
VADSRSTDSNFRASLGAHQAQRRLDASLRAHRRRYERLAVLGALVCLGSLVLPWYRIPAANRFEKSGLGAFGFAEAALLLTVLSALALIVLVRQGRRPPLPMHEGTLLAAAGAWSSLIVAVLMVDRPQETVFDFPTDYGLRYGVFVALGGAVTLALAGLRVRRLELKREAEAEARGPISASPPRSPR